MQAWRQVRTIANRRERFFAPGSLTAALAILASAGLLLVWLLAPPYQNSSGSINPPQWKARSSRPSRGRRRATPAAKPGGFAPDQPGELSADHPRVTTPTAIFGLPSSVTISPTTRATATSHVLAWRLWRASRSPDIPSHHLATGTDRTSSEDTSDNQQHLSAVRALGGPAAVRAAQAASTARTTPPSPTSPPEPPWLR